MQLEHLAQLDYYCEIGFHNQLSIGGYALLRLNGK